MPNNVRPVSLEEALQNIVERSEQSTRRTLDLDNRIVPNPYSKYYFNNSSEPPVKLTYSLEECLDVYNSLIEKNIGDIYICGAVALSLQGIIPFRKYKDLDLIVKDDIELDDDIIDRNNNLTSQSFIKLKEEDPKCKSLEFEGVPIDLFICPEVKIVECFYNNKKYLCQEYRSILEIKLDWVLREFKDRDAIFENKIKIEIL